MKLPKIKLAPSTRAKGKMQQASAPDAGAKPTASARQTTRASIISPNAAGPLPTSRWNINEPMPVLSRLRKQPAKEVSTEPPKDTPHFQTAHFELFAPEARAVFLAGSFNVWSAKATPMDRQSDGKWVKEVLLAPGRYEYQFVVDGRWTPDLKAADEMPNPFGGFNSVVEVPTSS